MTSITKIGGVMVVTQVLPDQSAIPLQTPVEDAPPPGNQVPPPADQAPPPSPTIKDEMASMFLRGEPLSLGVVQMVTGVVCVLFSLSALCSPLLTLHAPLGLAAVFLVSGAVAVAAQRRLSVKLVCVCLTWNTLAALLALVGVAYVIWLLAMNPNPSQLICDSGSWGGVEPTPSERQRCVWNMWMLDVSVRGLLGLVLFLLVLQVCVSVSVCVFSIRAVRRRSRYTPLEVEVGDSAGAALLDSEGTAPSSPNSVR